VYTLTIIEYDDEERPYRILRDSDHEVVFTFKRRDRKFAEQVLRNLNTEGESE
jgi:hypothetical protein